MMQDLDYLYAHHAVGLCPEERCVTARANLAALVEALQQALERFDTIGEHLKPDATDDDRETVAINWWFGSEELRTALQDRVASQEGSGT
jgi:hypothetical protein